LVLDTHTGYLEDSRRLSAAAKTAIEKHICLGKEVFVCVISLVEAVYLVERTRLPYGALQRLRTALNDPNSGVFVTPVDMKVAESMRTVPRDLLPDMPDRIIAGTALHLGAPLVSRDRRLQSTGIKTIW
jgi:PIN domain nuclease of toxin-antitoxin system